MQARTKDFESLSKRIKHVEHECDELTHTITTKLNKSFITPFDREDIYTLSVALDDVCDYIDAAARAVVMYDIHESDEYALKLATIIQINFAERSRRLSHCSQQAGRNGAAFA